MSAPTPSSGATVAAIPGHVDKLRQYFSTHVTKSYDWRKKQVNTLRQLCPAHLRTAPLASHALILILPTPSSLCSAFPVS